MTNLAQLKKAVELLTLKEAVVAPKNFEEARQRKFHFWETQPVPKFGRDLGSFSHFLWKYFLMYSFILTLDLKKKKNPFEFFAFLLLTYGFLKFFVCLRPVS